MSFFSHPNGQFERNHVPQDERKFLRELHVISVDSSGRSSAAAAAHRSGPAATNRINQTISVLEFRLLHEVDFQLHSSLVPLSTLSRQLLLLYSKLKKMCSVILSNAVSLAKSKTLKQCYYYYK